MMDNTQQPTRLPRTVPLMLDHAALAQLVRSEDGSIQATGGWPAWRLEGLLATEAPDITPGAEAPVDFRLPRPVAEQLSWPPGLRALLAELHSGGFTEALEQLTGHESLMPDPFLTGGGLRSPGEILGTPHALPDKGQYSRLMLLLPLARHWHGHVDVTPQTGSDTPDKRSMPLEYGDLLVLDAGNPARFSVHAGADPGLRGLLQLYYYQIKTGTE